jgi:hypothetical protein
MCAIEPIVGLRSGLYCHEYLVHSVGVKEAGRESQLTAGGYGRPEDNIVKPPGGKEACLVVFMRRGERQVSY